MGPNFQKSSLTGQVLKQLSVPHIYMSKKEPAEIIQSPSCVFVLIFTSNMATEDNGPKRTSDNSAPGVMEDNDQGVSPRITD